MDERITVDSDYTRCCGCGEYGWTGSHVCAPMWFVSLKGYHGADDFHTVHAKTPQEAAEKFAAIYDAESAEYDIVQGNEAHVTVFDENQANPVTFEVEGYSVPEYVAKEISNKGRGSDNG